MKSMITFISICWMYTLEASDLIPLNQKEISERQAWFQTIDCTNCHLREDGYFAISTEHVSYLLFPYFPYVPFGVENDPNVVRFQFIKPQNPGKSRWVAEDICSRLGPGWHSESMGKGSEHHFLNCKKGLTLNTVLTGWDRILDNVPNLMPPVNINDAFEKQFRNPQIGSERGNSSARPE